MTDITATDEIETGETVKIESPKATAGEQLAYVEGFLIGLARRLETLSLSYSGGELQVAADDCRVVAKSIGIVRLPMERRQPA